MSKVDNKRGVKLRGAEKLARIPVKIAPTSKENTLRKPSWLRVRASMNPAVKDLKAILRSHNLHSVCEEASCPNLSECFGHGTASFMIMGDICTRRCAFCDVAHGRPNALDENEPENLAKAIQKMQLKYVVITSVDRDDLRDGGAGHFAKCIAAMRQYCPETQVEVLVPDFRGRMDIALDILAQTPPDTFNHNIETAPRLYKQMRAGSDFTWSLTLLQQFKQRVPDVPTKSGMMLGLGETNEEVVETLKALRDYDVDMLTLGQYLQPSLHHAPVTRFVTPDEFDEFARIAKDLGFTHVASGPLVRSSYHADKQAAGEAVS